MEITTENAHLQGESISKKEQELITQRIYFAIDLKSFYASVECVERGLDPLTTNLLVADESRTQKTICLAVSPSLKAHGISGRARLFEAIQQVKKANNERRWKAPNRKLEGSSWNDLELKANPSLAIDYITAPPRMALYSKYSNKIYGIYLKYFAPEDIHDYSIDEVFIDATDYIKARKTTAHKSICFGKDDFVALNSQFYINGIETVSGTFYNVEEYVRHLNSELPTNLNMVSKYLKLKHDRHNPLSDSYVTLEYFKYLIKQYPQEEMERKIPSKKGGKENDTKL